jgi:hypothetical protein
MSEPCIHSIIIISQPTSPAIRLLKLTTIGPSGSSAYQVALANGFVGTEAEWLASLQGTDGEDGRSAYQVALANGFVGTEAEWLASLQGTDGEDGRSAYQVALANGFVGTEAEWLASLQSANSPGEPAEIVIPGVFFARANGNDAWDGTFTKPFATLQRALEAGEASQTPYVIMLGSGSFAAVQDGELARDSSSGVQHLRAIHGTGQLATNVTLTVLPERSTTDGSFGGAGRTLDIELHNLTASLSANGEAGELSGGSGGTIRARGHFAFVTIAAEGGVDQWGQYQTGGSIDLSGAIANAGASINAQWAGSLRCWHCDMRQLTALSASTIESGQTAWSSFGPTTDYGGNSIW